MKKWKTPPDGIAESIMEHKRLAVNSPEEYKTIARSIMLCLILAVIDQITKDAVIEMIPKYEKKTVIPGFFDLTYITNPGAAWGIMEGKGILLLTISMAVIVAMIIFFRKLCDGWCERYYALLLVVSGVLGNSYDRIFRSSYGKFCDGQVVDFLSFHIGDIPWAVWPSFNVADTAICVGVGLFILSNFIRPEPEKNDAEKRAA